MNTYLGLTLIAAIIIGVPIIAYCVGTLNASETADQRRKRRALYRSRQRREREVRREKRQRIRGITWY
jgi:hypothetical protein